MGLDQREALKRLDAIQANLEAFLGLCADIADIAEISGQQDDMLRELFRIITTLRADFFEVIEGLPKAGLPVYDRETAEERARVLQSYFE